LRHGDVGQAQQAHACEQCAKIKVRFHESPLPEIAPPLLAKTADLAEFDEGEMARPGGRKDISSGADEISFQSEEKLFVIFQCDIKFRN
jgi:hypothetical protein